MLKRLACFLLLSVSLALAQDLSSDRQRGLLLMRQNKAAEARPLLEKAAEADPKDVEVQMQLGFALHLLSQSAQDSATARALRLKARACLLRCKELGSTEPVLDTVLAALPEDGSKASINFSKNAETERFMQAGEAAFGKGEFEKALEAYQKALERDPKLYEAALFAGDTCFRLKRYPGAEDYYARAVAIDPGRETAYRYWGNTLSEQRKFEEARSQYIQGILCEPYSRLAWTGIRRLGEPHHPQFPELNPQLVSSDQGTTRVSATKTDDPLGLTYSLALAAQLEKTGRHSLASEVEALKAAALSARQTQPANPPAWLPTLLELDQKGLLEAYVLLARPDQSISQDYPAYLKAHRPQLVRYLSEYYR
ncbi:tetratricopeptide repeat protein [bacterium]|nr:tetratricopeptide repeat protein [bacterium]